MSLGVEMTVLRPEERTTLMRGMILRRLRLRKLNMVQVGVGLGEDINKIRDKFSTFDFETYVGDKFEPFLEAMIEDELVSKEIKVTEAVEAIEATDDQKGQRAQDAKEEAIYGPGVKIPDFEAALTEDMVWFIDELPMSTRGLFDNLLNDPSRQVTVDINDVIHASGKDGERIVEDSRDMHNTRKNHLNDHGLRAGPTGKV